MSSHAPTLYVSVEEKISLPNYEYRKVTVGLSGLPFDADEATIQQGLDAAQDAIGQIRRRIRDNIRSIRMETDDSAFEPELEREREIVEPILKACEIPAAEDVVTPDPHEGWDVIPIPDNYLVALNAGLSGFKITGNLRHKVCSAVLGRPIKSTKDLSKLEAHQVLEVMDKEPERMTNLYLEASGQEVLI